MPTAHIDRGRPGRVAAALELGGDVSATIDRGATGRVDAALTVTEAGS